MGEIMSSLGLETGKNLGKQCTCADNFSNLLKRGPTMKKLVDKFIRVFVILFLGAAGAAQAEHVLSNNPTEWWSPDGGLTYPYVAPDEAAIPPIGDPRGDRIRAGKQILEETYKMLGPDSGLSQSYVGNRLSCSNCHVEVGRAAYGQPWAVIYKKYGGTGPWSARSNMHLNMTNRIHDCTERSMNGFRLPNDSPQMLAILEYMTWLGEGIKDPANWSTTVTHGANNIKVGEPVDSLGKPRSADPVRGKTVYEDNCAGCHGYSGEGIWNEAKKVYIYPAVWGQHSFNDGAGMFRIRTAVGFIKGNMPYGWANPTDKTHQLSEADVWDSMAYVLDQQRPLRAGNAIDWLYSRDGKTTAGVVTGDCAPNWLLKVTQLDAGYESYYPRRNPATGKLSGNLAHPPKYSPQRHKYGPWIVSSTDNMIKEMENIQAAWVAQKPATRPAVCPDPTLFEYTPP